MTKTCILTSDSGKGAELAKQLIRELGIPENVTSFSVSFSIGEPVVVSCTYRPIDRDSDAE